MEPSFPPAAYATVPPVPKGPPPVTIGLLSFNSVKYLWSTVLAVAAVDLMESIALGKAMARLNGCVVTLACSSPGCSRVFPRCSAPFVPFGHGAALQPPCPAPPAHNVYLCRYAIDSNDEYVALGLMNVIGSFFSIYPATGSFSRTAVNNEVGASTPMSCLTVGAMMGACQLFFWVCVCAHCARQRGA